MAQVPYAREATNETLLEQFRGAEQQHGCCRETVRLSFELLNARTFKRGI